MTLHTLRKILYMFDYNLEFMIDARLTDKLAIQVDGQKIEETSSEKLLGLVINNKLSWKEHE